MILLACWAGWEIGRAIAAAVRFAFALLVLAWAAVRFAVALLGAAGRASLLPPPPGSREARR